MSHNDDNFDLDNPTMSGVQVTMIIVLVIIFFAWLKSDDLKEAGLWLEDTEAVQHTGTSAANQSIVNTAQHQKDRDNVHYLLVNVAKNQVDANAAYEQGLNAAKHVNRTELTEAIKELDRGVVRMANAKEEKTKVINNASAKHNLREGLHLFWQINTVRRNYFREVLTALNSSEPAQGIQTVVQKYKEIIPAVPSVALQGTLYFIEAKRNVGLPADLSEFKE